MHPRDCRHSLYMRRPDTMHPRNELPRIAALFLLIFCASFVIALQSQPAQPSPTAQSQSAQTQSSTPSGVHREGTDNILVDAAGIPLEDQSGKSIPQENAATPPPNPAGETNTVSIPSKPQTGQPTTAPGGGYKFIAHAQEVVLHATVVDQHSRLVTNLNKNDFTVYEDGQP